MLRKLFSIAFITLFAVAAQSIPAKRGLLQYPQPDGSTVEVSLHGDEFGHWYESEDGYVLVSNAAGWLEYATIKNGTLSTTGIKATPAAKRTARTQALLSSLPRQKMIEMASTAAKASRKEAPQMKSPAKRSTGLINNYPTTGSPKAMVLLVEFADVHFTTPDPQAAFQELASKEGYSYGGAYGSTLDYFKAQSEGIFTPDFQVYGPIRLDQNEAYYGASTAMAYDTQAWLMVRDACEKLRQQMPELDWSEFDNDGDGFVDSIFLFYAGYGQNEGAPSWTIWPHSAKLYDFYKIRLEYNGVVVNSYACTNELQGTSGSVRAGIGTFCHEYSHVLGLPDLYGTDGSKPFSPGDFELMDHGSYNNNGNTPPNYSAFERYSVGWLNPRALSGAEDITLHTISTGPLDGKALMIRTDKDEEYFILENRQQLGWDTYLPGHGMLVWHIDFDRAVWINNQVNNMPQHQRVDLIEADNVFTEATRGGDPFPGTSRNTTFTSTSSPAMTTWTNYDPDMPLTDIHESENVITFKVKGGGETLATVNALDATDVTPVSFVANWEAGTGVYQYEVDVCLAPGRIPFATLSVTDATSVMVTGLTPNRDYSYVVRAKSGERLSEDSNRIFAHTADATFEQRFVTVLEPENVRDVSFVARWEAVDDAAGYLLTVVEKNPVDPTVETVDFSKNSSGTNMPQGWTSTSTTTGSLSGYYGQAAPALRLSANTDRITSPTFSGDDNDINTLSFWYRGNSTADDAALSVEGLIDNSWTNLMNINPLVKTAGTTVNIGGESADAPMPHSVKAIRIVFTKTTNGSVYIDDIALGHGGRYVSTPVGVYDDADQGNVTSAQVEGLKPMSTYYYSVRAYDSTPLHTAMSDEMKVTTTSVSGIDDAETSDGQMSVMTIDGAIKVVAPAGTQVKVYDVYGRLEATATVGSGESVVISLSPGFHTVAPVNKTIYLK